MKQLLTTVDIEAPPEAVWTVLVDLPSYARWNPFIVEADGVAEEGATLRLRMTPPGGRAVTLRPKATVVVSGETFEWLGRVGFRWLFTGRHRFELQRIETGTRLVQGETFTGVLVPFLARSLDAHTLPGLIAMNAALKSESERTAVGR